MTVFREAVQASRQILHDLTDFVVWLFGWRRLRRSCMAFFFEVRPVPPPRKKDPPPSRDAA